MSWIEKLHQTYERCATAPQFDNNPPLPPSHSSQQAHIQVTINQEGDFLRAAVLPKEQTTIPVTEQSAGRTSSGAPHPLSEKIQYCAADYAAFGGAKKPFYTEYVQQLRKWESVSKNPKIHAVLRYIEKGCLVADLVREQILHCSPNQHLLTAWTEDSPTPELFKMLTAKDGRKDQGDAFVRWQVQIPGDPQPNLWEDPSVQRSWSDYDASQNPHRGMCIVTGERVALAANHPRQIRHGADKAKLISSNDSSGFTYRGRFATAAQACGVGAIVTQKSHNALRWLIRRQGYCDKATNQIFVAWEVSGRNIPDPFKNTAELLHPTTAPSYAESEPYKGDAGQLFALRLNKMISGYRAELGTSADVVVMGLDSATPGRMAITFYRELKGSEFLDRISLWHAQTSWVQKFAKNLEFIGAPSPADIATAKYPRPDANLRRTTVERLLPCIIDGRPLPRDIVESCVRRAYNRVGFQRDHGRETEWEKCLGIACALYRGWRKEENYQMSLEEDRITRDYLFGRLLAIADYTERQALRAAGETRDTNAAKLMYRFAHHPCSAWRNIELALAPYKSRLRADRPGQMVNLDKLLDEVIAMFQPNDFTNDSSLSGEFLLGFHCQRGALWNHQRADTGSAAQPEHSTKGEES